jgi:GntR family transcriptional repressor for pyruvate dehydrogenase complex
MTNLPINALRPVLVTRLADDVVQQVRALIIERRLSVGDRLPSERALAQTLRASRATVSQALRILSIMGLVEIRPGSGAYIVRNPETMVAASVNLMLDLDPASLANLAELRAWLELGGIRQAIAAADESAIAGVAAALVHMSEVKGSASMWLAADAVFHGAIMRASNNDYFATLFESVHSAVVSTGYQDYVTSNAELKWLRSGSFKQQQELHTHLYEALRDRDPGAATQAVLEHHRAMILHMGLPPRDAFCAVLSKL